MVNYQEYYENYWKNYWKNNSNLPIKLKKSFEKYIIKNPKNKILDVGCGDGQYYAKYIIPFAHEYIGLDISYEAIEKFNELKKEFPNVNVKGITHDVNKEFPFEKNYFDVVLWIENAEHLVFPLDTLKHIEKVLKPGGILIMTVPNTVQFWNRILFLFGFFNATGSPETGVRHTYRDPHLRFFNKLNLHNMFKETESMDIMEFGSAGNSPLLSGIPYLGKYFEWEQKYMAQIISLLEKIRPSLFAGNFLVIAQKNKN